MRFFSPSTLGFYDDRNPVFQRTIDGTLTAAQIKAGRKPKQIDNPECKLPTDAKPVSETLYESLMAAVAAGQVIAVRAGRPIAIDHEASVEELLAANTALRNRLLADSDWTQLPDALLDAAEFKAAMAVWRQALRDMDLSVGDFPAQPDRSQFQGE